ncbi:DUF167 domain-containing protein [Candidatus Woesearchaeota archaeon]|nr:DUF167 domain-containing protein [Candidatus Woesearchaeota archaeon]
MKADELKQLLTIGKRISLKVKTQMPVTQIVFEKSSFDKDNLLLFMEVHAAPENNKANVEILKFFSKNFKLKVRIVKGFSSREKIIEIC